MNISLKKLVQQSPLDVNLWVNRTSNLLEGYEVKIDPIVNSVPMGHQILIPILNWEDWLTYAVSVKYGYVSFDSSNGVITYTAPYEFPDDIVSSSDFFDDLTVEVTAGLSSYTYLPDDTLIDSDGILRNVADIWDSMSPSMQGRIEASRKEYAAISNLNGLTYKIENQFPSNLFQQSWEDDPDVQGGISNYENPYNIDTEPSDSVFFYRVNEEIIDGVKVKKPIYKPRNSNIDEADGDVLTGYRFPGAVGSSLTVIKGNDSTEKKFIFKIPLGLDDIDAIIPDEVLTLCVKSVSVLPIIRGNSIGHTFEWEQISGDVSEVTWTVDPETNAITITIGNINADRVFRLWISRGTIYEKYVDMVLYATPKDTLNGYQSNHDILFVGGANLKIDNHETHPILLTAERIWGKRMRVNILRKIR